jgi:hypothetical protein
LLYKTCPETIIFKPTETLCDVNLNALRRVVTHDDVNSNAQQTCCNAVWCYYFGMRVYVVSDLGRWHKKMNKPYCTCRPSLHMCGVCQPI